MPKDWTRGTTKSWSDEEGWGVISSPGVPGDVWAHFSDILGEGFSTLKAGEPVEFRYEEREQDGYNYAVTAVICLGVPIALDLVFGASLAVQLAVAVALALLVPVVFFRYSRSLWLAIDRLVTTADETGERRSRSR